MTDREIMQQALDALKQTFQFQQTRDVIAALEAALAQPEQEHIECGYDETVGMCTNNPCCEQAQPEQEPVAKHVCNLWINPETSEYEVDRCTHPINEVFPVYTAPPKPEQEPEIVQRVRRYAGKRREAVGSPHINAKECIALANWIESMFAQPEREWVGLTDDEINKIVDLNTSDDDGFDIWCDGFAVARIVCAKIKEKNT